MCTERAVSRRLCWAYVLYYAGYMSCFSFLSVYLSGRGFDAGQIAVVNTGVALVNFGSQFVMGRLAARLSPRRVLGLCLAAALPFGLLLGGMPARLGPVLAALLPLTLLDFTALGQLDALTLRLGARYPRVQYSRMRALGGLSGAVLSAGLGDLLARRGMGLMFAVHTAALAVALMLVRGLPEGDAPAPAARLDSGSTGTPPLRLLPAGILLFHRLAGGAGLSAAAGGGAGGHQPSAGGGDGGHQPELPAGAGRLAPAAAPVFAAGADGGGGRGNGAASGLHGAAAGTLGPGGNTACRGAQLRPAAARRDGVDRPAGRRGAGPGHCGLDGCADGVLCAAGQRIAGGLERAAAAGFCTGGAAGRRGRGLAGAGFAETGNRKGENTGWRDTVRSR